MCGYQEPEVYVKRFVGCVLSGFESVQFFFNEVRRLLEFLLVWNQYECDHSSTR